MTAEWSDHRRAGQRLAVLRTVSRVLAGPGEIADNASTILEVVCLQLGWDVGTLWVVDEEGGTLLEVGTWRHPSLAHRYVGPLNGVRLPSGVGLPGRVWAVGSAQWGMDLDDVQRTSATSAGLVGAVGFPIMSGTTVAGVLELLSRHPETPDDSLIETLESVSGLCAQAIRRDEMARAFAEADAKYRALVEQIPAIVYIDVADGSMTTSYVSPQIESILGITPAEYVADPDLWEKHLHPEDKERALREAREAFEIDEPHTIEYRLIARDGRTVWFRDSSTLVRDSAGHPAFLHGVMLDITERKLAEEQAAFLAYHDKLTELPNRAMFEELLELSIARAKRHDLSIAVLYADLDNFKLVNESLGHEAGDRLLKELAERMAEATRETDLVARQGGDEFLLLLGDLERENGVPGAVDGALLTAESVASRIEEALRRPFVIDDTELFITASVGISLFPQDAEDAVGLLSNAHTAMYQSRALGPGGYAIYASETGDALSKLSLTTRLRKAVESRNWVLHYQPVVDLERSDMIGVEALLRWRDPNGGLIPPGEFIPLAEEMGLIEVIGDWVIEELCRQERAWRREHLALDMSFNLSPRQIWQEDIVQKVLRPLEAAGTDPSNVVIEITESTAMSDPERTQRVLWDLHAAGLRIALDDFGTGFSSLSRLKLLPVDILKIDRAFVRDVGTDPEAASMVRAIIQLAQGLGMTPLAEGIETEQEAQFLRDAGCRLGQGYHLSRPVPAHDILSQYRRAGFHLVAGTG